MVVMFLCCPLSLRCSKKGRWRAWLVRGVAVASCSLSYSFPSSNGAPAKSLTSSRTFLKPGLPAQSSSFIYDFTPPRSFESLLVTHRFAIGPGGLHCPNHGCGSLYNRLLIRLHRKYLGIHRIWETSKKYVYSILKIQNQHFDS
jgi:hypothetical protein